MGNEKRSKALVFHYILRLACLILFQPNHHFTAGATQNQISTSAVQLSHTCDELNLGNRMSVIEAKSKNQEDEIALLKTLRAEDKTVIDQLKDRVEQLETKGANAGANNEKILERQKRPFRLAPANFRRGKENEPTDDGEEHHIDNKFYGPPTSCDELDMLGYTLNGFYTVQGKNLDQPQSITNKIEVVYCQFHQSSHRGTKEAAEDRLGQLNIKSGSGIYFYVQRKGNLINFDEAGVIRFTTDRLNIGRAMNLSTSVFTAPKAGIYHFSFSILKDGFTFTDVYVYLRVNGNKISTSQIGTGLVAAPISIQSTLKLKKGDRVDLWKPRSGGLANHHIDSPLHHFTGWLLEDLE